MLMATGGVVAKRAFERLEATIEPNDKRAFLDTTLAGVWYVMAISDQFLGAMAWLMALSSLGSSLSQTIFFLIGQQGLALTQVRSSSYRKTTECSTRPALYAQDRAPAQNLGIICERH